MLDLSTLILWYHGTGAAGLGRSIEGSIHARRTRIKNAALWTFVGVTALSLGAGTVSAAGMKDSDPSTPKELPAEIGAGYGADQYTYEYGFDSIDRDGDGYISKAEAKQHKQALGAWYERLEYDWQSADSNAHGQLDKSEFSALEEPTGKPAD